MAQIFSLNVIKQAKNRVTIINFLDGFKTIMRVGIDINIQGAFIICFNFTKSTLSSNFFF